MRSTNSTRSVVVGIFTVIAIAIFVVTILTLGSQHKIFMESLTVDSYYTNVNGLLAGDNVWYGGVKVGNIKSVKIMDNGKVEVRMNIDQNARKFIHNDAMAKLSSDGMIGNKIVEIYGGTPDAPIIEKGDIIRTDEQLDLSSVMKTLSRNNDNLVDVTHNLKVITTGIAEGNGTLGKLLTDETLMDQIVALTKSLNQSASHLDNLTSTAANYVDQLNKPGSLANDLVTDTVVFSNLKEVTQRLNSITDSSQQLINSLGSVGRTLDDATHDKNTPIGLLVNDKTTTANIKSTLTNLNTATKKLDEDLEALQHNFLFRRFFKKKAKETQRVVVDTLVGK